MIMVRITVMIGFGQGFIAAKDINKVDTMHR
jgi:hypothetical protein